jgi:hypothetical protein
VIPAASAGMTALVCQPSTQVGYELIGAGMLILAEAPAVCPWATRSLSPCTSRTQKRLPLTTSRRGGR